MKQCVNCSGFELYDDGVSFCPHCNAVLVPYAGKRRKGFLSDSDVTISHSDSSFGSLDNNAAKYGAGNNTPLRPNNTFYSQERFQEPEFESRYGGRYNYRGRVVSISSASHYVSGFGKWFNSVFRGIPYQRDNPEYETVIRIEEISRTRMPDRMRSLVFYGELPELNEGDDVSISAVQRSGRLVVKNIIINDIETAFSAYGLHSATAMRLFSIIMMVIAAALVFSIISFFSSGGIFRLIGAVTDMAVGLVTKLLIAIAPLLVMIFIFRLFFGRHR